MITSFPAGTHKAKSTGHLLSLFPVYLVSLFTGNPSVETPEPLLIWGYTFHELLLDQIDSLIDTIFQFAFITVPVVTSPSAIFSIP